MDITLIICTHNRSLLLTKALDSIKRARRPACEWELIVVANACTDNTLKMLENYKFDLPLHIIEEDEIGLSHARNTATKRARGKYLIWTDDDTTVEPNFFEAYLAAFEATPQAGYWGGRIRPYFDGEPPAYIRINRDVLRRPLLDVDFGVSMRPFVGDEAPVGANMAFKREFTIHNEFDVELGRKGNTLLSGEEEAFFSGLRQKKVVGMWVPDAVVNHYTHPERVSSEWLAEYFFGLGRSHILARGKLYRGIFLKIPPSLYIAFLKTLYLFFKLGDWYANLTNSPRRTYFLARINQVKGMMYQLQMGRGTLVRPHVS